MKSTWFCCRNSEIMSSQPLKFYVPEPSLAAAMPFGCCYKGRQPQGGLFPPAFPCRVQRVGVDQCFAPLVPRPTETQAEHSCRRCSPSSATHGSLVCHTSRRINLKVPSDSTSFILPHREHDRKDLDLSLSCRPQKGVTGDRIEPLHPWASSIIHVH